jgi:hypothetical protein
MKKETLKNILNFLEEKETHKIPFLWKWLNNEPIADNELVIKGDLDLSNRKITSLPKGLEVKYNLYLAHSDIETLPKGLKVGNTLYLNNCENLKHLPEDLDVKGSLYLQNCKNLKYLPEGLKVGGLLDLTKTIIESLPKGLKVGGALFTWGTPLEEFSDNELIEMVKPGFIRGKIYR